MNQEHSKKPSAWKKRGKRGLIARIGLSASKNSRRSRSKHCRKNRSAVHIFPGGPSSGRALRGLCRAMLADCVQKTLRKNHL